MATAADVAGPADPASPDLPGSPLAPPIVTGGIAPGTAPPIPAVAAVEAPGYADSAAPPPTNSAGLSQMLFAHRWLLMAGVSAVGLAMAVGTISILAWRKTTVVPTATVPPPVAQVPTDTPTAAEQPQETSPDRLPRRWLPERTMLLVSVCPSQWAGDANSARLAAQLGDVWQRTVAEMVHGLGLKLEDIRRITWAATDLSAWPDRSVAIIELAPGRSTASLASVGEAADFSLAGSVCRRMPGTAWQYPLAVVDQQTIVTGHETLLRHLAGRSDARLASASLERMLKGMAPAAAFTFMLDLAAARKANWKLPTALWDFWPAGKQAWHVIWELPEGLGCAWQCGERLHGEVALVCEGETAAEKVRAALDEFMPAAKKSVSAQIDAMPERLKAGQFTVAVAEQYELLLKQGLAALQAARWEISEGAVWMRVDCGQDTAGLSAAAIGSRPVIWADWLSGARTADEAMHRRLLAGLGGYQKAEGRFPAGAAGGALLPPETRLSWIAALLPYYDHADWHRKLEFGYAWNGPQNREVSRRPLPEVVNPALGPDTTDAGFPVTHYVGVAGVGEDAGQLGADHPRAGLFGYGRGTRREEITRGSAHTIAMLGASGRLGPWAAGGHPTVRPLTKPPYVNGPDGFGSGQPDGMLAGMADGSVRFISKQVDPRVLEQLATVGGGHGATVSALDAKADAVQPATAPTKAGRDPQGKEREDKEHVEKSPRQADAAVAGGGPAARSTKSAVAQTGPDAAEVAARLATPVAAIELTDVPLLRAVRTFSSMSNLPITFDPDTLAELEITLSDPVKLGLKQTSVAKSLEAMLSGQGLIYAIENGQVLVTSPLAHRETLRPRRYTVADLTDGDPAALMELAALVQKLVAPDSWQANGGRGELTAEAGVLRVVETEPVHHQILTFCEKLRIARGRPLRSRFDPSRFLLSTRLDRAKPILERTVTASFHEPTPLAEILAYLEECAEADILVDYLALGAAGQPADVKATLKAEKRPLAAVLSELLGPLGLACRAIDAETLQVTSRKALDAHLELEFYPIAEALAKGQTAPALMELIQSRVAGSTWSDAGGPAVLCFDKPSGCLLVLQSQPVHAAIQQLLAEKAN